MIFFFSVTFIEVFTQPKTMVDAVIHTFDDSIDENLVLAMINHNTDTICDCGSIYCSIEILNQKIHSLDDFIEKNILEIEIFLDILSHFRILWTDKIITLCNIEEDIRLERIEEDRRLERIETESFEAERIKVTSFKNTDFMKHAVLLDENAHKQHKSSIDINEGCFCGEDGSNNDYFYVCKCSKTVCWDCVLGILENEKVPKCPTCRSEIPKF